MIVTPFFKGTFYGTYLIKTSYLHSLPWYI